MNEMAPRSLTQIASELDEVTVSGDGATRILSIVDDSRAVIDGSLFIALDAHTPVGSKFLADAILRGAAAVVIEASAASAVPAGIAKLVVPKARPALARIASAMYNHPADALRIVGITGTNGKTTTSFMVATLLADAGIPTLRIGTLGAAWQDREVAIGYTTPPPLVLHHLFAQAVADGVVAAVMEVSSHALALERVADVPISIGVFTNLTQDHLDFHETFEAYAAAKRELFLISPLNVFNIDDPQGRLWCREFNGVSYAIDDDADVRAHAVDLQADGSQFTVDGTRFHLPLPGRFNVQNALAALAVARTFGIDMSQMQASFSRFRGVPGRMERFATADCAVFVDYAHTADALERVLLAAREGADRRSLTVVFGCGGDRDAGKRPQMGAVAERLADRVIVTSDNPRSEDPQAIADAVIAGGSGRAECILDRRTAITRAILEAPDGAVVVIAGKGAELEQIIGTQRFLFDDRRETQSALAQRAERRMEQL